MSAQPLHGTPGGSPPVGRAKPSPEAEMERAIADLRARRTAWTELGLAPRLALLRELVTGFAAVAGRWVDACLEAERIPPANPQAGEEWLAGPYMILRNVRLLEQSLLDIRRHGRPRIPGPISARPDGQVVAQVFPARLYDRIFYPPGMTAEVWMQPDLTLEALQESMAEVYRQPGDGGGVALVLGAGNVSSIGPMDMLYKLFVENRVVLYKVHPVNDYLGPLLAEAMQALIAPGFLRLVYGGAAEGAFLCQHPEIDEIHITGSAATVEAIVFGPGPEGARRKAERRPRLTKPISSELGNVSPVIVVPGPWSAGDLAFHGESIVSMLANNAGFNCNAARVLIQHASWPQRDELLAAVRRVLTALPPRTAYYPGADERWGAFVAAHPQAETFGRTDPGELPWTLIPGVDAAGREEICFSTEAFASVFAETAIEAPSIPEFLRRAVDLANDRLWGTLNATIVVHPASLRDPEVERAVDRAIADLRYGTVTINQWAAVGYGLVVTPWGAWPGHDVYDIQSGSGVVHNTLMFARPQKTVVRVPFRVWPKPPWFVTHRTAREVAELLTRFEIAPSPAKLPAIVWAAMRG